MKAFPFSVMTYESNHPDSPRYTTTWHEGMDLRDYFAAKALPVVFEMIAFNHKRNLGSDFEWSYDVEEFESMADMAYGIADAMMKAREENHG